MTLRNMLTSLTASMLLVATACDAEDDPLAEFDADDLARRDLSSSYGGAPVLIQNIDAGTCLAYDGTLGARNCDWGDDDQFFTFDVQTFVGGLGFVYKVCAANDPSMCLTHDSSGSVDVVAAGEPSLSLLGQRFDEVRIQHDERNAFIEFRYSGKCLTPGTPISAQTCDWFGSTTQQYRLLLNACSTDQDCEDGERCVPIATDGGDQSGANACVPVDDDHEYTPGHKGDPCGGSPNAPICDDPTTTCATVGGGTVPRCLFVCDPVGQDCHTDQACMPTSDGDAFVCVPDQVGASGPRGAACEFDDECSSGLFCAPQSTVAACTNPGGCCNSYCDLNVTNPNLGCWVGETCQPWFPVGNTPPGYEHVGFCGIP